jgi:hypothetical protein
MLSPLKKEFILSCYPSNGFVSGSAEAKKNAMEFFFPWHFYTFASHGKELPCPYSIIKKILWADTFRLPPPVFIGNICQH